MSDNPTSEIKKLKNDLMNIPVLPKRLARSIDQELDDVRYELESLKESRKKLAQKSEIEEFDRLRFELTRERLDRKIQQIAEKTGIKL